MKFTFIILHYLATEVTIECIDSILNTVKYANYEIVLVDNKSPNNSGDLLLQKYEKNEKVYVILNDENSGFAQGNNIGYKYAKNILNSDFMAIINNDTVITDELFIEKILKVYEKESFHILGPDVIEFAHKSRNKHQNPLRDSPLTIDEINDILSKAEKLLRMSKMEFYIRHYLMKIKNDIRSYLIKFEFLENKLIRRARKKGYLSRDSKTTKKNVILQGAALIFSPIFIADEEYSFYPDTFMYGEEDILHNMCMKKKYIMIYSPEVYILHKESVSTQRITKTLYSKYKFGHQNTKKSFLILKEFVQGKRQW